MPVEVDGSAVWDAWRCRPVVRDPAQLGESCAVLEEPYSGIDDCDVGLMCWKPDEQQIGTCEDLCISDDTTCANPEEVCVLAYAGSVPLCVPECDPLMKDQPCASGDGCYPGPSGWGCFLDDPMIGGTHGDQCPLYGNANHCDPGFVCMPTSSFTDCASNPMIYGCCTPVCNIDDPTSDAMCAALDSQQVCTPWLDPAPDGYAQVGVCALP